MVHEFAWRLSTGLKPLSPRLEVHGQRTRNGGDKQLLIAEGSKAVNEITDSRNLLLTLRGSGRIAFSIVFHLR